MSPKIPILILLTILLAAWLKAVEREIESNTSVDRTTTVIRARDL